MQPYTDQHLGPLAQISHDDDLCGSCNNVKVTELVSLFIRIIPDSRHLTTVTVFFGLKDALPPKFGRKMGGCLIV